MNDAQRAEKLALARKKLKDFEARRKNGTSPAPTADGRCSSLSNESAASMDRIEQEREPFQVVNSAGGDNLHIDRQTNGSSVSSVNSSVVISNGTQDDICASNISHPFSSAIEARLIQERDTAVMTSEQLKAQLSELHSHYAHLHAAYSQLSNTGVHSDMESQIIQLQSAVSVLVEEKTTLQADLRTAREQCEQIASSVAKSQTESINFQVEQEIRNLRTKLDHSNSLVQAQTVELEQLRKLSAELQAKNLSVQNEKSEAQLRVKALVKERDLMNEELLTVKKDLQMKNLHVKQLSMHQNPADAATNDQIHNLNDRLEVLINELNAIRTERDTVVREAGEMRRQFEQYSSQMAEKNGNLQRELEEGEDKVHFLEQRLRELQDQLNERQHTATPQNSVPKPTENDEEARKMEESLIRKKLEEHFEERAQKFLNENHQIKQQLAEQNEILQLKEEEILSLSIKLRQLDERMSESRASESEVFSLSEQLQSEKATVSRAVAQNKELKEALLETEDRLVAVTNDKMQFEMDKEAAEYQVRQLTEQLFQLQNSQNSRSLDDSRGDDQLDTSAVEALVMRNEREHELEQKLQQSLQELSDLRQELRQSHSRNEQMNQIMMNNAEDENQNSIHVELGHALERLNQLASENEHLREGLRLAVEREGVLLQREAERNNESRKPTEQIKEEKNVQINGKMESDMDRWAKGELEKKFMEAMSRNAELLDNMEKLEHINVQLQMENETIGDHVILYHQQRRIIRDRLRVKDQQLLTMEVEKQRVVERCRELQQALKEVLASKDLSGSPVRRKVYRSYSHSTVDEMSGDEDVVISGEEEESSIPVGDVISKEEGRPPPQIEETEAKVQRIFSILDEISTTPVVNAEDLHCSQCIGELKKL